METTDYIDYYVGQPSAAHLARASTAIQAALVDRFRVIDTDLEELHDVLNYAPNLGTNGARAAVASYVSANLGLGEGAEVPWKEIFIGPGCSASVELIARNVTKIGGGDEGDEIVLGDGCVVVEDPTYFLVEDIFEQLGYETVPIGVDEDGLMVDELTERIEGGLDVKFVYTIPVFHNPTGVTMSAARRESLVALSKKHNFVVIADEVYQFMFYQTDDGVDNTPPLPLRTFDTTAPSTVLSVGSFSKTLSPGLRVGYIWGADRLTHQIDNDPTLISGGAPNAMSAGVVQSMIETGSLQEHSDNLMTEYGEAANALWSALVAALDPEVATVRRPRGGYFLWIEGVDGRVDKDRLWAAVEAAPIRVLPGTRASRTGLHETSMRLCFARMDERHVTEGVAHIAACYAAATIALE